MGSAAALAATTFQAAGAASERRSRTKFGVAQYLNPHRSPLEFIFTSHASQPRNACFVSRFQSSTFFRRLLSFHGQLSWTRSQARKTISAWNRFAWRAATRRSIARRRFYG
jgi:hypothetical protein